MLAQFWPWLWWILGLLVVLADYATRAAAIAWAARSLFTLKWRA